MSRFGIQSLRKNSRSTLIYVLFGMLIIVFVFTFNTSGPGGCATSNVTLSFGYMTTSSTHDDWHLQTHLHRAVRDGGAEHDSCYSRRMQTMFKH